MTTRLTIDKAGRVVIPKPVRKALHLDAGDSLTLDSVGDEIILRLVHGKAQMQKENGIWVYRTGKPLEEASITDWIDEERAERIRDLMR